jgi:hypothetical protein
MTAAKNERATEIASTIAGIPALLAAFATLVVTSVPISKRACGAR